MSETEITSRSEASVKIISKPVLMGRVKEIISNL